MNNYHKTFTELESVAAKFWPIEISEQEADSSVVPLLLETQDKFISILAVSVSNVDKLFTIIESSDLPNNLFLKHLVIMADFGGEMLKRVSNEFANLFPEGKLLYFWQNQKRIYTFNTFNQKTKKQNHKFSNQSLKIRSEDLFLNTEIGNQNVNNNALSSLQKDAIALLLFGSAYYSINENDQDTASTLARCEIGSFLGKSEELNKFIKQRYIYVSRITGGAKSNTLGQIAQKYVTEYIKNKITESDVLVTTGGRLPNVTHTDEATGRLTSFDIVIQKNDKYVAIEVSFQVTTNSVIERKGSQAKARYEQIENAGHKIAYVINGAGNFERQSAVANICSHSHCTVAFTKSELNILCEFIRKFLEL
jgi:hypothetical protein